MVTQRLLFMRGYGYIGSLGIGYLVASKLQEQLVAYFHMSISLMVLFPLGVLGVWIIGWMDHRFGFWQTEAEITWDVNPKQKRLTDADPALRS